MILTLLRFGLTIGTAYFMGKLVARIKLPAILGWLLTGMILGPTPCPWSARRCWTLHGMRRWSMFWSAAWA